MYFRTLKPSRRINHVENTALYVEVPKNKCTEKGNYVLIAFNSAELNTLAHIVMDGDTDVRL